MKIKASQIAELINGSVDGNPDIEIHTLSKIEEGEAGAISFLANPKYEPHIYSTQSSVVIVNNTFQPTQSLSVTLIRVEDAYQAFTKLLAAYSQIKNAKVGVEKTAIIDESAHVGEEVYIGNFTYIGTNASIGNQTKIYSNCSIADDVQIGERCVIHSGVRLYSGTQIGNDCIIHSNTVIGSDGFGFAPKDDGSYEKVPQIGKVIIGNKVEIGACSTIDCATMGATIIHDGVKLDNQIQIAHNVEIGKNTVIAAQTGIAGSTKVGEQCVIGGQVGIVGHLTIGDKVKIQAQSGVTKNIKNEEVIQGTPAFNYKDFSKSYVYFKQLPELLKNK